MDLVEDIHGVMRELQKSVDASGNVNMLYLLREVMKLFERMKGAMPGTNLEERKKIFAAIGELHQFLLAENQRLSEKTGISEEQMVRYAENPDNFTKEQWNLLLEVKKKMGQQAQDMREIMQKLVAKTPSQEQGQPLKKHASKPKKKGSGSVKKRGQVRA